jgi:hypothetical protein
VATPDGVVLTAPSTCCGPAKGKHQRRRAAGVVLVLLFGAWPGLAQEVRPEADAGAERRNEIALVLAGTRDTEEDATFFTLGVEYERRLAARWAIVGEVEYLFDADRWVVAAPIAFRPARGLKLFAGPGLERADEEGEGDEEDEEETRRATHGLVRLGAGYTLEFAERYSIGPAVSVDFVREDGRWVTAVVFGVTVGMAF